jgi:hypothetical protein
MCVIKKPRKEGQRSILDYKRLLGKTRLEVQEITKVTSLGQARHEIYNSGIKGRFKNVMQGFCGNSLMKHVTMKNALRGT